MKIEWDTDDVKETLIGHSKAGEWYEVKKTGQIIFLCRPIDDFGRRYCVMLSGGAWWMERNVTVYPLHSTLKLSRKQKGEL